MPYTNVWNNTTPTGAEAANTIDDIFRTIKVDISDRLDDIFGGMPSFSTDPLRPYGLKFTDAQDAVINLGDNAGTPRNVILKNKGNTETYHTLGKGTYTINRVNVAAGTLGYINVSRASASLYWLGQDASDHGAILSADAGTVNLSWDNTGNLTVRSNVTIGVGNAYVWTGRSIVSSPADGNIAIFDNALTDFNRLQFGGTTASFPALKRSLTNIQFRLADDSAYTNAVASAFIAGGNLTTAVNLTNIVGVARIAGGTTGTSIRNNTDAADLFVIDNSGNASTAGTFVSGGSITLPAASVLLWSARSQITSPADGNILLRNNAGTDFTFLQLGGTTSSFPGFTKLGTTILAKLADGSDYTKIGCKTIQFIDATANFQFSKQVQVSVTGATAICAFNGAGIAIVKGTSGGNQFSDLVTIGNGVATVLAANTNLGAPAARTYSVAGTTLSLSMASGTYLVDPVALS